MTIHSPGDVIGDRYRVTAYIGEGGMQEVYEAHDVLLDRSIALKTPKTSIGDQAISSERRDERQNQS